MKNTIAQTSNGLIIQGSKALAGLTEYRTLINIVHSADDALTNEITDLITGVTECTKEQTELTARIAASNAVIANARDFCFSARDVLKTHLGKEYSTAWIEAGFNGSIAVPSSVDKLLGLLLALKVYFTENASHENTGLNVSATRAQTFYTDITAARNAVNSQKTKLRLTRDDRDEKAKTLRTSLRHLLKELSIKLTPLDARWRAFGFNLPGALATPAKPTNVEAALIGPTSVAVKWSPAVRASHYRVWKKTIGEDVDFVPVGNSADLDCIIEGLTSNSTVEICVSAINNGGESVRSDVVTVNTP